MSRVAPFIRILVSLAILAAIVSAGLVVGLFVLGALVAVGLLFYLANAIGLIKSFRRENVTVTVYRQSRVFDQAPEPPIDPSRVISIQDGRGQVKADSSGVDSRLGG